MSSAQNNIYCVKRNRGMSIAWFLAGCFFLLFGWFPWLALLLNPNVSIDITTQWLGLLFFLLWASIAWVVGGWLIYSAWCRIEFEVKNAMLIRRSCWGPIRRTRIYRNAERVYLVFIWRRSRHRTTKYLTLVVRHHEKKKILTSELSVRDLPALYAWMQTVSQIKCVDLRDRAALG